MKTFGELGKEVGRQMCTPGGPHDGLTPDPPCVVCCQCDLMTLELSYQCRENKYTSF